MLLRQYEACIVWANRMATEWLLENRHEKSEVGVPSGFKALQDTVIHMWVASEYRRTTIEGQEFAFEGKSSKADHLQKLTEVSERVLQLVNEMSDDDMQRQLDYPDRFGEGELPAAHILHHMFNHTTYHCGQLIVMSKHFDFTKPPSTDYSISGITHFSRRRSD